VGTVEQGIEILTGSHAGKPSATGKFPADSIFGRVHARLFHMAHTMRKFD
jgi:Lon-like ATP-dependent protease